MFSTIVPSKTALIKNFNWREYLIANTDLIDSGILTEELAIKHYYEIGARMKRPLKSKLFDWTQYIAINSDLIDRGYITKEKAEKHYIDNGYKEGRRIVLKDFDWVFYVYFNNHLIHAGINTQTKAIKHWIEYGRSEGLFTTIKPLEVCYQKMICHNYENIFDLYRNVYDITSYPHTSIDDPFINESSLHFIEKRNQPYFKPLKKQINLQDFLKDYEKVFLIVDFPCFGGGCSFFLNSIISHYKYHVTFLIVRNFKNKLYWYGNDEIIFEPYLNEHKSLEFIKQNKLKIEKVFFNSIVEHSNYFINEILNMNFDCTILTHDYSLFFKNPQMYYYDIHENMVEYKFNIHKFNRVITQHAGNLHSFGKYMNDYNNIIISALPDYRHFDKKIMNENKSKFVIGIIGDISDVKGYYVVNELWKKIQSKKNIELVIFGKVHIKDIKHQYSYHTIEDLNNLLITYKPNLLFETSLWPESFSFTLSLSMITRLPIIYQNKFYPCTVQRRLSLYNKGYSFNNIQNVTLKWILSKGQDYFFTIKPQIFYPPFWDEYFLNRECKTKHILNQQFNVVIITSKIYTSSKPFSYAPHRSIYSTQERFQQVQKTIESVREHIPDSFVVLYDNSDFNDHEYNVLNDLTDCFINHHNDAIVNEFTNNSIHKVFGEISQTFKMLEYIKNYFTNMNIKNLFKITGRYLINNSFDYNTYENDDIIFKRNKEVSDRAYYFTCFYKISGVKFDYFYEIMEELYEDIQNNAYEYEEWEVLLPMLLHKEFKTVDHLGITQDIAVWKDKSEI
jgi:hypothetical protein